jgi:hypothetical protein
MPELKVFVFRPHATAPNRKVVLPLKAVRRVTGLMAPSGPAAAAGAAIYGEDVRGNLLEIETAEERIVIAIE